MAFFGGIVHVCSVYVDAFCTHVAFGPVQVENLDGEMVRIISSEDEN